MASLFKKGPYWYLEFKDRNAVWRNRSTGLRWNDPKETRQAHLVRSKAESAEIANEIKKVSREGWDWVDEYLESHCTNERTLARYLATWETFLFWLSEAGIKCPRELDHNGIVEYVKWRTGQKKRSGKQVSQNTAIMDLRVMSQVMAEAVRRNLAERNPAKDHGFKKSKPKKKPEMTDEEIRKIWIALQDKDEWMRDSFLIALHTGCRLRETIIPMNCIDLAGETITFPAPKGGEEKAFSIPMPKALKPTFERMKADKRKVTLNMPFQPSRKWGHFFKMLGLSHLCFHCLRVTKVTRLRREGVPREVAMRLVNHSSELIHLLYDRHRVDDLRAYSDAGSTGLPVGAT